MSLLIICDNKEISPWLNIFQNIASEIAIQIYPDVQDKDDIKFILMWSRNSVDFKEFKNLKCVSSMGAGVDHILENNSIQNNIDICKIVDNDLANSMWEYLLGVVMSVVTKQQIYKKQQQNKIWKQNNTKCISQYCIGIMGLGKLGSLCAGSFNSLNFKVKGYSYSKKDLEYIECFDKSELNKFIQDVDILINLMPLTKETNNFFNKDFFSKLNKNCYFINVGRGEQVNEKDLINALNIEQLSGATLDVFSQEPLSINSTLWEHEKINITPHIASISNPNTVIKQIVNNYYNVCNNQEVENKINRAKNY
jgi:glyoxylate/hydroxypyruvate reductase A